MLCAGYSNNTIDSFHFFQLILSNVEDVRDVYKLMWFELHSVLQFELFELRNTSN